MVGCGGHGRETLELLAALGPAAPAVVGVVDDSLSHPERLVPFGVDHLGAVDALASHGAVFVVAIGDPAVRRAVAERCEALAEPALALVHPGASLGSVVQVGPGTIISDRAVVTTNVRIGRHVQLNVGSVVSHDSVVEDYATLSPGVIVNGDVHIGAGAFLGTGAIVVRGHRVGAGAIVGAGAVVVADVPDGATVVGVPARVVSR
ncbi:MAG: Acetyltransferase (isoleucine patch superfamily)-like protein [Acidimicrobiales bacterium]|nr:Acetyltransferase (isoleucine patch superfamily)-like protein [Acidimicrobiales bacterium]